MAIYRKEIVDGFQKAIEPVPMSLLNQLAQPLLEDTDEFVYSNVLRPIIARCQSSYLTVPHHYPWMHYNRQKDYSSSEDDNHYDIYVDHVTARDACLFDDEYDSDD